MLFLGGDFNSVPFTIVSSQIPFVL